MMATAIADAKQKSKSAFRTIAEASTELGVETHVLRFWESKFPKIKPVKMRGGRRYYRPDDIQLIKDIKFLLYDKGFTIRGVQKIMSGKSGLKTLQDSLDENFTIIGDSTIVNARIVDPEIPVAANSTLAEANTIQQLKDKLDALEQRLQNFKSGVTAAANGFSEARALLAKIVK